MSCVELFDSLGGPKGHREELGITLGETNVDGKTHGFYRKMIYNMMGVPHLC